MVQIKLNNPNFNCIFEEEGCMLAGVSLCT